MIWLLGDSWIEWQSLLYWKQTEGPWIDHTTCLQAQLAQRSLESVVLAKGGSSIFEQLAWAEWYANAHTPTHIVVLWTELARCITQDPQLASLNYTQQIKLWAEQAAQKLIELETRTGAVISVYGAQSEVHPHAQKILGDRVRISNTRLKLCGVATPQSDCISAIDHQLGGDISVMFPRTPSRQCKIELKRVVLTRERMQASTRFPDGGHPDAQYYSDLADVIQEDHRANV